jgi:hypothetical protein
MGPTEHDRVFELVENGPVCWNLGGKERHGEARSPCVVAELDAVVVQGKVTAVPGEKSPCQCGQCIPHHRRGRNCRTGNLEVGSACEECTQDESTHVAGWMAAGNEIRTLIADDSDKLDLIRDRSESEPLFLQVYPILIPYVETADQDNVSFHPLLSSTRRGVWHVG